MKSIFLNAIGQNPGLKILEFMLMHDLWDYSLTDIAEYAEVSYSSVKKIVPKLVKANLVEYTRSKGKAKLFQFKDSIQAKAFNTFHWEVCKHEVHKSLKGLISEPTPITSHQRELIGRSSGFPIRFGLE